MGFVVIEDGDLLPGYNPQAARFKIAHNTDNSRSYVATVRVSSSEQLEFFDPETLRRVDRFPFEFQEVVPAGGHVKVGASSIWYKNSDVGHAVPLVVEVIGESPSTANPTPPVQTPWRRFVGCTRELKPDSYEDYVLWRVYNFHPRFLFVLAWHEENRSIAFGDITGVVVPFGILPAATADPRHKMVFEANTGFIANLIVTAALDQEAPG